MSISVRNRLKSNINIDVYLSASRYQKSTFCISYLKVVILLQDSLKIKVQNHIPDFLYTSYSKVTLIKISLQGYEFFGLI